MIARLPYMTKFAARHNAVGINTSTLNITALSKTCHLTRCDREKYERKLNIIVISKELVVSAAATTNSLV